ncbi:MAG: chemotaxis-specific protein-glutamate methyltransferase CheB [Huintestinicola sp.]|uniref:chemotaxis-specific protein-glutamate methyltransferase CheB n=1 Tax=Huintestinicola sp. TaxID=2981661 RepID=UPI003F101175
MIKVLIVDDSMVFSELLKKKLSEYSGIKIVGTASDPYQARDKILELEPDIMTLDIEMPRMDGVKFLKRLLPQYPLPVIMISSREDRAEEAVKAGAASFRVKPDASDPAKVNGFIRDVASDISKICTRNSSSFHADLPRSGAAAEKPAKPTEYNQNGIEIVALGASTGGTDALEKVILGLPDDCPPIIITQHMPPVFTKMYAERLNRSSSLAVFEASDGMRLKKGMCVIAAGGFHMELHKDSKGYYISSKEGEKVSGHCPSVDVMFTSVAKCAGKAAAAAILTGMGADGAKGLLLIRQAGGYTVGQNKETCVVYGMPMEAYKLGAVCDEAPLEEISSLLKKKMNYPERS